MNPSQNWNASVGVMSKLITHNQFYYVFYCFSQIDKGIFKSTVRREIFSLQYTEIERGTSNLNFRALDH